MKSFYIRKENKTIVGIDKYLLKQLFAELENGKTYSLKAEICTRSLLFNNELHRVFGLIRDYTGNSIYAEKQYAKDLFLMTYGTSDLYESCFDVITKDGERVAYVKSTADMTNKELSLFYEYIISEFLPLYYSNIIYEPPSSFLQKNNEYKKRGISNFDLVDKKICLNIGT